MNPFQVFDDIRSQDWRDEALCAQVGGDHWHPEKGAPTKAARRVCNGDPENGAEPCPVRAECLQYALDNNERYGIWGGLSERQRRELRPKGPSVPRKPVPLKHGTTTGFYRGCRCEPCKAAYSEYQRQYRAARRAARAS